MESVKRNLDSYLLTAKANYFNIFTHMNYAY
jgi:hypothetical protein